MQTAPSPPVVATRPRETLGERLALLERCEQVLRRQAGVSATIRGSVPGRIELFGKHVDYAGGRSIVCAVDRGFVFAAAPRTDHTVRVTDVARGESRECALDAQAREQARDWGAYVATVARRVARDSAGSLKGVDVVFASDLPPASGLSSSTALVILAFLASARANAWFAGSPLGPLLDSEATLADYLAAVESGRPFAALGSDAGVGTLGGSQDHAAILSARPDRLSRFAFLPTRLLGGSALPDDVTLAVAFSGVHAEKTGAARDQYNRASVAASELVRLWRSTVNYRGVQSLRAIAAMDPRGFDGVRAAISTRPSASFTAAELMQRLEHFMTEELLHDSAALALRELDWEQLGELAAESQHAAEELLGNQVPETSHLAASARGLGALAASAFGAGFGGSVWALVSSADATAFVDRWRRDYAARFPDPAVRATFFVSRPAPAAHFIA